MLRKIGIVLTVIALGMTAVQTDAFARGGGGGGHGGGGGGHGGGFGGGHGFGGGFGGGHGFGGGFGGGHIGGGFAGGRGFSGGHMAVPGRAVVGRGLTTRSSGLRVHGRRGLRRGFGGFGWDDGCYPYDYNYPYCYGY